MNDKFRSAKPVSGRKSGASVKHNKNSISSVPEGCGGKPLGSYSNKKM